MRPRTLVFSLFTLLATVQACRPARHVEEGKYIVSRSKIHINEECKIKYEGDADDLESAQRMRPYRRWFGVIPFNVGVWNFASTKNQDRRLWSYLKTTVGEAPPIFEPILLQKSIDQMKVALRNDGYFDGEVRAEVDTIRRKVKLNFYIESDEAYTLKNIGFAYEDTAIAREFKSGVSTKFQRGTRFDTELFESERNRLTQEMKNRGYYTFDNIHVIYEVDTNLPGKKYVVTMRLRDLRLTKNIEGRDTLIRQSHQKHYIRSITVNEVYNAGKSISIKLDTATFKGMDFLYREKPIVRPARLSRNLFIRPGDRYSLSRTNYTYERLNALRNFRFIDMRYTSVEDGSDSAGLDLLVNLTKMPKQSFVIETTGTHRSGNLGIYASLDYRNRNVFRGAEQLDWSIYGGLESQRTNSTDNDAEVNEVINGAPFNTYEFGTQVRLTIPDFMLRLSRKEMTWAKEPKTNISASIDRQLRPQYERTLINTNYQYTFRLREKDLVVFAPVDLSVIELTKQDFFERQLQLTNNQLLINSYNDHIIAAGRLSYSNTTQQINTLKNFHYYKINFETAGNLLRAASSLMGLNYDAERNSYLIDDIAFAQYVKLDADYVWHQVLTDQSKVVYRTFGGIGIPLTNLNVLPFERSFFAGGSNDIRAWRARALGPGGLSETETYGIDQVGEVQIEFNAEYRFHIIKMLEGAVFLDVGNIWLMRKDSTRLNAEFAFDRFYKEIAIAPGAGLRLDFDFFILRGDLGLQLRDPQLPEGERWLFDPKVETMALRQAANELRVANGLNKVTRWERSYLPQLTFNLGIHYPF